jgi:tetratricopeptide (TPR) repeat protein
MKIFKRESFMDRIKKNRKNKYLMFFTSIVVVVILIFLIRNFGSGGLKSENSGPLPDADMANANFYEQGIKSFNQGEFAKAAERFGSALKNDPQDLNSMQYLALSEYNLKQYPSAIEHLEKVVSAKKNDAFLFTVLANMYRDNNQPDRAIENYQRSITANGSYMNAYANLATVLRGLGRIPEAREAINNGLKKEPANSTLLQLKAQLK